MKTEFDSLNGNDINTEMILAQIGVKRQECLNFKDNRSGLRI